MGRRGDSSSAFCLPLSAFSFLASENLWRIRNPNRAHSRESAQASSANEPHQKGLGLIGHCVSNRNAITACFASGCEQEVVSNLAGYLLDPSPASFGNRANID